MIIAYYEKSTRYLRGIVHLPTWTSFGQQFGDQYDFCVLESQPSIDPRKKYIVTVSCTVEEVTEVV